MNESDSQFTRITRGNQMTRKSSAGLISLILLGLLAGCSKEPPKCSDEATFGIVRNILLGQMGGSQGMTEKEIRDSLKFNVPRAVGFDEKLKTYRCEATIIAGNYQLPIRYQSQLDDKNEHLVMINGISTPDLNIIKWGIEEELAKSRMASGKAVTPPEVPLQSKPAEQNVSSPVPTPTAVAPSPTPSADKIATAPALTFAPSFDCAKATTATEKSICSEPLLGKLDGALAENYKFMLAANIGDGARNDLKQKQRKWISERNLCKTNECLVNAYRSRIDEVCEYPVLSGVHPVCVSAADIK